MCHYHFLQLSKGVVVQKQTMLRLQAKEQIQLFSLYFAYKFFLFTYRHPVNYSSVTFWSVWTTNVFISKCVFEYFEIFICYYIPTMNTFLFVCQFWRVCKR